MPIPLRSVRFAFSLLIALALIFIPVSAYLPGVHSSHQLLQKGMANKAAVPLSAVVLQAGSTGSLSRNMKNIGNINLGFDVLRAIAVDSINGNIYAVSQGSNIVSVIDGSTNNVVSNISVGASPYDCTFSPRENEIFVTDNLGISVISCQSNRVVSTIKTGGSPESITYDAFDNCVYASLSEGYLLAINAATHKTIANISNDNGILSVDSANGFIYALMTPYNFAAVVNDTSNAIAKVIVFNGTVSWASYDSITGNMYVGVGNSIAVVNGTTNGLIEYFAQPENVAAFAIDQQNGNIYVGQFTSFNLMVINPVNGSIVTSVSFAGYVSSMEYDPVNNNIYDCGLTATLYALNATTASFYTIDPGHYPQSVAFSSHNGLLYVSDPQSDKVLVINATENRVTGTIPAPGGPGGIAYDYLSNIVYVSNEGTNSVAIINGTTNTNSGNVDVGITPDGIIFDPHTGDIYALNYASDNITVLNGSTGAYIRDINLTPNPNANSPYEGVWDSLNNQIYVTNQFENNISVINPTSGTMSGTIGVGNGISGIAFDPANGFLYVSCPVANLVSVINASTGIVISNITVGQNPAGISYDPYNGYVYVAESGSNDVGIINSITGKVVATVSVGNSPEGIAFDSGNGYMYVSNYFSNSISVVGAPSFNATFSENGLANATWTLRIAGTEKMASGQISLDAYTFFMPEGNYSYAVSTTSNHMNPTPAEGNFTMVDGNLEITINFNSPHNATNAFPISYQSLLPYSAAIMTGSMVVGLAVHEKRKKR